MPERFCTVPEEAVPAMRMKLQTHVFLNFVLMVALFAVLCSVLGAVIISKTIYTEEQRRVDLDLRVAWAAIDGKLDEIDQLLSALVSLSCSQGSCIEHQTPDFRRELESIRRLGKLDFIGVVDARGSVIMRGETNSGTGDNISSDPVIYAALQGETARGYSIIHQDRLKAAGLEERAFMVFEPTPKAKPRAKEMETAGMALQAAIPVVDAAGVVKGVIYGGVLLNRNHDLVDRVRSIVFEDRTYGGQPLGTVTIFQWDVRVATNVMQPNGNRAIGTRVSAEVYDKVLENNRSWNDRAFVVSDWYISAYEPIHNYSGDVIGILYVGVLAERYDDIERGLWGIYGALSVVMALLVIGVGYLFARRMTGALNRLAHAADRIAEGDLEHLVPEPSAADEVRDLTNDFNAMAASLRDRDARLRAANAKLEEANASLQKLNANYLDMLGFVSHELKNTLGVIYTAAQTLDAGLVGDLNEAQSRLAGSIARSIRSAVTMTRNYLDLSRIEKGELVVEPKEMDFAADVARPLLGDFKDAIEDKGVTIVNRLPESIPMKGDRDLLQVVFRNLLDNALKYGREGGEILIGFERTDGEYWFEVRNEGEALAADQIERLFQKFARPGRDSEARRKGTGLGLFITKNIINKHGGEIHADAEEGKWMSFIFTLPAGE